VPSVEREINTDNLINLTSFDFDKVKINQDFIYINYVYFLLHSSKRYSIFCPVLYMDRPENNTKTFAVASNFGTYLLVDKMKHKYFSFACNNSILDLNYIKSEKDNQWYLKMDIKDAQIFLIDELVDIANKNIPQMSIKVAKNLGDFEYLWIYNYHDGKKHEKMYAFSEINAYNLFDISYNEFLGLYSKYKKILKYVEETEVEEIPEVFEESGE
jgi:hypothetical protein